MDFHGYEMERERRGLGRWPRMNFPTTCQYVLPPGVINANRGRNRQSGTPNDRYDSLVIAETLRTDLHKFIRQP